MSDMNIVAVVPVSIAQQIITGQQPEYNSIPNMGEKVISVIREFMIDNVGFENLPIACLTANSGITTLDDIVGTGIAYNYKDSVLFQLSIPDDMVVSARTDVLLEASNALEQDPDDSITQRLLQQSLHVGEAPGSDIYFIPFIDLTMCKFYSMPPGSPETFTFKGIENRRVTELAIFTK